VNEPQVLLLDEPLGALDLKLRKQLQVELHQLQRRLGITFIHVTHDQDEALVMSDRIAVMNEGRIEQVDSAEVIYEHPRTRFVAQFLGSCNLASATVTAQTPQSTELAAAWGTLHAIADRTLEPGRRITVGIRPEKIRLHAVRPKEADNVITGTVHNLVYSGAETRYELRAGAAGFSVVAMNTAGGHSFPIGSQVECELPAASLVLPDD
jgi:spermidine/putrescine transport system ATP-binding protein